MEEIIFAPGSVPVAVVARVSFVSTPFYFTVPVSR